MNKSEEKKRMFLFLFLFFCQGMLPNRGIGKCPNMSSNLSAARGAALTTSDKAAIFKLP